MGANVVAMIARLDAFWQVWFALDRITASGIASSLVLVSYTKYTVLYSHTHTHKHKSICPHTCFHAVKLHFNCMSSWQAPWLGGPLLVRYSSRLKWDEAVWRKDTLHIHRERNTLHLSSLFFLLHLTSPCDSLSWAGSQAKGSIRVGWNHSMRCVRVCVWLYIYSCWCSASCVYEEIFHYIIDGGVVR